MKKIKYSAIIGLKKSLKNSLIIFVPSILAFLAAVPIEYAPIAGFLTYFVNNAIKLN